MTNRLILDLSHAARFSAPTALPLSEKRASAIRHDAALVIAAATLARLAFASLTGLGVDESYTVATARTLDLSYFDHPPLCWWMIWTVRSLFHSEAPVLLRMPFIALSALSSGLLYRLTSRLFSPAAGFWAITAFTLAPVLGTTSSSWILPDGPLMAALLGMLCCLVEAESKPPRAGWPWWIGTGLCAGLALLSKLTAVPVIAGVAIALLSDPLRRHRLAEWQPWVAAIVALVVFSPVLIWNMQHHWCSFAFQGGRARAAAWHPLAPLTTLAGQALFLLPWIWAPLMIALAASWKRGRASWGGWLLACCATPTIAIFALVGLWSGGRMLYHWADAGYLVALPLLGEFLAKQARLRPVLLRRVALASAGLICIAILGLAAETRWGLLPPHPRHASRGGDADFTLADWTTLEPQMRARGWLGAGQPAVAALRWHIAGRLDYALGGTARVICLGGDPREYGVQHPAAAEIGKDLLVLAPATTRAEIDQKFGAAFDRIDEAAPLYVLHGGRIALEIPVYIGRGFRG